MPRRPQKGFAGRAFHAMNRCQPNELLFDTSHADRALIQLTADVQAATRIRVLAYCLMPNHWHFILWPSEDGQLTAFVGALTMTHAKRRRKWRGNEGAGAVYPDRFLAVLLPAELNLFRGLRYVERNPVRAGFMPHAEAWPWSSASPSGGSTISLAQWPGGRPENWLEFINQEESPRDIESLRAQLYARRKRQE